MAHYFAGRKRVGDPFVVTVSDRRKVSCAIFKRWEEKPGFECCCGLPSDFKITKEWGVSEKESSILETTIGGSIGKEGIAQLKSEIKDTSGHEVEWTYKKAEEMTYRCEPTKCGCKEIRIFQLVYEYDLIGYRQGGWIFRKSYWDIEWGPTTLKEETGAYSSMADVTKFDPRCKECKEESSPGYDGRLSFDLGQLCMLVPYKLDNKGLSIYVGKFGMQYWINDYQRVLSALSDQGLTIEIAPEMIEKPLLFLSDIKATDKIEGNARFYSDLVAGRDHEELPRIELENLEIKSISQSNPQSA